jgi:hypothetical protein
LILNRIQILKAINNKQHSKAALLLTNLSQTLKERGLQLSQNEQAAMRIISKEIIIEKIKTPLVMLLALYLLILLISYPSHTYIQPFLTYIFYDIPFTIFFRPLSFSLEFLDIIINGISNVLYSITHLPDWVFRLPLSVFLFLGWLWLLVLILVIVKAILEELSSMTCKLFLKNISKN